MDISKIKTDFGENDEQRDENLLKLLDLCYKKETTCQEALIKAEKIIPFTDYEPEISEKLKAYFMNKIKRREPMRLLVYQDGEDFIMSDDYNAYYFYKKLGLENIPCIIIGEVKNKEAVVKFMGEPFYLGKPSIDIVGEENN